MLAVYTRSVARCLHDVRIAQSCSISSKKLYFGGNKLKLTVTPSMFSQFFRRRYGSFQNQKQRSSQSWSFTHSKNKKAVLAMKVFFTTGATAGFFWLAFKTFSVEDCASLSVRATLINAQCDAMPDKANIKSEQSAEESQLKNLLPTDPKCRRKSLRKAINFATNQMEKIKTQHGVPGLVVAVSIDGQELWAEGFGYADLEKGVPCKRETVMRIASISKPITTAIAARLVEEGKLDLDLPVQHYVKSWPRKTFDGKEVTITTRQLASHLGGVRHYQKPAAEKQDESKSEQKAEFELGEYYIRRPFKDVTESLELFKDDPLLSQPGTTYLYTTHGFTLLSAVLEGASGQDYSALFRQLCRDLDMSHTVLDQHTPIIYNRASYYARDKDGRVINAPYVNNSYKWAGGGLLSTVSDLCVFGNAVLYSAQHSSTCDKDNLTRSFNQTAKCLPGYLNSASVAELWRPVERTMPGGDNYYAQGWSVTDPSVMKHGGSTPATFHASHTGGAIGASSAFVILPRDGGGLSVTKDGKYAPRGVVVAILCNMQAVSLHNTALDIAKAFDKV